MKNVEEVGEEIAQRIGVLGFRAYVNGDELLKDIASMVAEALAAYAEERCRLIAKPHAEVFEDGFNKGLMQGRNEAEERVKEERALWKSITEKDWDKVTEKARAEALEEIRRFIDEKIANSSK